jgi:maltoporin
MRKLNVLAVSVMAALMAAPAMAEDNAPTVDFHGYMRAGVGHFSRGGSQTSFQEEKVGRLGNESDTYGEIELGSRVFKKDDVEFYVDSMVAMKSKGDNDYEGTDRSGTEQGFGNYNTSESAEFALRQLNVQVKGIIPGNKDAVIWAGKRYYQRHDVHLWDFYYWNVSGSGAGLENLKVGPGQLSVAWMRKAHDSITELEEGGATHWDGGYEITTDDDGNQVIKKTQAKNTMGNVNLYDIRYAGSYWDGGYLEFGYTAMDPDKTDGAEYAKYVPGWSSMYTVEWTQSGAWGFNKATFQAGNHGFMANNHNFWYQSYSDNNEQNWWRIIDQGEVSFFDPNFHVMYAARYDHKNDGNKTKKTIAVTVRPSYQVTTYSKVMAEIGAFWDKNDGDGDEQGQKYTLAYALSPSASLWARPEVRFYVSYLHSSNADSVSDQLYDGKSWNSGVNFGVQAEAWW